MKKVMFPAAVLSAFLHLFSPSCMAAAVADRTEAIIGNEVILKSELDGRELMARLQYPELAGDKKLREQILNSLIEQKIILTKAKIDSVAIDEHAIEGMADERFQMMQRRFSSREDMESTFGKSLSAIRSDIVRELTDQQLVETLRRKKFSGTTITNDEVMKFYKENRDELPMIPEEVSVSQILMFPEVSPASKAAAREKIAVILEKLRNGEDFAALARSYSGDPGSAPLGGDLGLVHRGELVKPFEDAAWALDNGEISGIVETRYGFHIIQRVGKSPGALHLRHILIAFDKSTIDEQRTFALLDSIRTEVLDGRAGFAAMADRYSDDPVSARLGGAILAAGSAKSRFSPSSMRPQLQEIIASLQSQGAISKPVKLDIPGGEAFYGIFRLDDRLPAHRLDPKEDYALLEEIALEEKKQKLFVLWTEELRDEVYVRRMDD